MARSLPQHIQPPAHSAPHNCLAGGRSLQQRWSDATFSMVGAGGMPLPLVDYSSLEPSRSLRKVLSPLPAHSIWLTSHVLQLSVCGPSSRMPRLHVAHVWAGASCVHTGACLGRQGGHPVGPPRREAPRWVVLGVCRHSCLCRAPQVQLCDRFTVHECLNMLRGSPDRDVRSGVRQLVCGVVWLK